MGTAILIDGAFFLKRFRRIEPDNYFDAERAADLAWRRAMAHLKDKGIKHDLYRIFFYDCPPLEKQMRTPIGKKAVNFKVSAEAVFRRELHQRLRSKRKLALRLGHLSDMAEWTIKARVITDLLKGKRTFDALTDDDVVPSIKQKGVDMRIGVDISTLVLKKQVDQIVLIAGDADFLPAAKLARREGVDFVLDPMWLQVSEGLHEHIDGRRSTCPRPSNCSCRPKAEEAAGPLSNRGLSGHFRQRDLAVQFGIDPVDSPQDATVRIRHDEGRLMDDAEATE